MIQTTSTKCQYSAAISRFSDFSGGSLPRSADPDREQPDDADGHVGAVEAGQREEARAEQVGRQRQPFVYEVGELVHLHPDEKDAAEDRGAEPADQRLSAPRWAPLDASTTNSELNSSRPYPA